MVALAVLALAPAWGIYKPRAVLAPMVLLVLMIGCTVYSQFGIIPAMERDRIAAGGAIDTSGRHESHDHSLQQAAQPQRVCGGGGSAAGAGDGGAGGVGGRAKAELSADRLRFLYHRRGSNVTDLEDLLHWSRDGTTMKTGIIGLPQVGKTSLFRILTKAKIEDRGFSREAHIGVARVPDERLDKLSALYSPKKTTFASVEYVDVAAIGQEALKETAFLTNLRNVDALIHVLRAFENDAVPHEGPIDPLRDAKSVEFDLMVSDLTQVEKRMERVEKDMKKGRTSELEREQALLLRSKESLEKEIPLRELEMTAEEKKLIRGFMFLSQKPILYVLNVNESTTLGADLRPR